MKAVAVFPGSQQVKIIEQDIPRLAKPDQVALRLLDVGICGTDKTIAEKALEQIFAMMQNRPPWLDPQTPSHERGKGLSALVLGIGPVGLLGAMTLATAGFTTYVYSRELPPSPRIDLVDAIGATYASSQTTTFPAA